MSSIVNSHRGRSGVMRQASLNAQSGYEPSPYTQGSSKVYCWGNTMHGELGVGGIEETHIVTPIEVPLKLPQTSTVLIISCGESHSLLLTNRGEVLSCGNNDYGQIGRELSHTQIEPKSPNSTNCEENEQCETPNRPSFTKFVLMESLKPHYISKVACGGNHSVAVNEWGQLFSWGCDMHGQLGINGGKGMQTLPKTVKNLATSTIVQVACGENHTLALSYTGQLYSWGSNTFGQLGLGSLSKCELQPTLVTSLAGIPLAFIACGGNHSFAVSKSGAVFGWGKNTFGQLGLSDIGDKKFPSQLKTLRSIRVKYIACGDDFSVFLTSDGGVFTCGAGMYGQLGHGSLNNETLPRKVLELMGSTVTQVVCGRKHTLAFVPSRGRVYSFGIGGAGQLGAKISGNSSTPQVVMGPWLSPSDSSVKSKTNRKECVIKRICAGGDHCFGLVTSPAENIAPDDFRVFFQESQILTLNEEQISRCAPLQLSDQVDLDILGYLETVFSSQACLNGSFLQKDDEHYCCTSRHNGVDIPRAEEFFISVSRLENASVKEVIFTCITLNLLPSLSPSPPDVETLRVYLLLPMFHEFENPRNYENLHVPFANACSHLKVEAVKIVNMWWGSESTDYFERLIRIYKHVVMYTLRFLEQKNANSALPIDRVIVIALDFLANLNRLNSELRQKVPYDTFYLPELPELVDIQLDYVKWLAQRDPSILPSVIAPPGRIYFCNYPFVFDAQAKTVLLETDQSLKMQTAMTQAALAGSIHPQLFMNPAALGATQYLVLNVSRENIVQDTIRELGSYDCNDYKKPLKVKFCGEEAEDAGGVKKEFFMLLLKEILDPAYGMFRFYEESRAVWFSEVSFEDEIMYFLIGVLCGLAIYNFTIINLPFPLALYKKLLNEPVSLEDVAGLSRTIAKSLQNILDYQENDLEDVFQLTFEMSCEVFGEIMTFPLKPNGSSTPVTQDNKVEFVELYVDMLLNKAVEKHFQAFHKGFHKVCGGRVLELFHSTELMAVVTGNENYNWDELKTFTQYKNGYSEDDPTIHLFWEVFMELPLEEKRKFLMFLTGSDRIPIQGMKAIKLIIQPTNDDKYLPVAHTCFNLLDLPRYGTKEKLRYKLLQAIQQNQGFSLV